MINNIMPEVYREEVAIERDWCLWNLVSQAEGRHLDSMADQYLLEQLNVSHVADASEGNLTECQVGGCALQCVTVTESGILRLVSNEGQTLCGR